MCMLAHSQNVCTDVCVRAAIHQVPRENMFGSYGVHSHMDGKTTSRHESGWWGWLQALELRWVANRWIDFAFILYLSYIIFSFVLVPGLCLYQISVWHPPNHVLAPGCCHSSCVLITQVCLCVCAYIWGLVVLPFFSCFCIACVQGRCL